VLQCPRVMFTLRVVPAARVGGAQGTPVAGLRSWPGREKSFHSNLLLALIDISPLLINRGFFGPLSKDSTLSLNLTLMGLASRPIRPGPLVP
jgi:hypothetical protein